MGFENLRKKETVKDDGDVIFGSTFESDIYPFTIDMAYVDEYESGAAFMFLSLLTDDGRTLTQRIVFTSGDKKDNAITYPVKDSNGKPTGEERYLPGFTFCSDLHMIATEGVELADMTPESKLVKVWDKDSGGEKPMNKQVLVDLIDKRVLIAVTQHEVFKQVNQDGTYVETDEIVTINELDKVFHEDTGKTMSEIAEDLDATYKDRWLKRYQGTVVNKTKKAGKQSSKKGASKDSKAPAKKKMFG